MLQLAIKEPSIEQYFNNSSEEVMDALKFIVENQIDVSKSNHSSLSTEHKEILAQREKEFLENPELGRSWNEIKEELLS